MILEMPVEQFAWLSDKLEKISEDTADLRVEAAATREKLGNINEHLTRINGRVGKTEMEQESIKEIVAGVNGAWKLLAAAFAVASAIGGGIAWASGHWAGWGK